METKTYTVYKFDELSEETKRKAIDRFIEHNDLSYTWDQTQEDAKEVGIKLHGTHHGTMTGEFITSAEDCIKLILANHGPKCETYKTAKKYKMELYALRAVKHEDAREEKKQELLRSICEDYRIMQEKDEEYQNSDECVIETIKSNDYSFTEDGKID